MFLALAIATADLPPMVEVAPDVYSTRAEAMPVPPSPKDRSCVRRWRTINYIAQAADVASTVAAIETGKGAEGNPLYKAVFGKKVTSLEVLAFKAVSIGITEWSLRPVYRAGDYAGVCTNYKISAGVIGGVALFNLRVFF